MINGAIDRERTIVALVNSGYRISLQERPPKNPEYSADKDHVISVWDQENIDDLS